MLLNSLIPTGSLVLAEAIYRTESPSGLSIPFEAQERYPYVGLVISTGPKVREDIRPGDYAIFSTEMYDAPNTYVDHFSITLRDGLEDVRILVDIDVEPIFRDNMREYNSNPSTEDRWIQVKDIQTDVAYKFLTSDVIDFGPASIRASSVQNLRYINTRMFPLSRDGSKETLHYLVEEREIEAVVRREEDA